MLGYESADEMIRTILGSDVFQRADDFQKLIELLRTTGEFHDVEAEWKRKDGAPITVRCSGRSLDEDRDASPCFEVFAEDVTERRVLECQLRMAAKMEAIGRLSGGIAHDFNNLLGVIIGYSQILRRKLGEDSSLREHAEEVEKAGQRAVSLTRQLLAFSRQQILTPAVLNLNTLVSDMEKMLPRLIGEDIAVTVPPESRDWEREGGSGTDRTSGHELGGQRSRCNAGRRKASCRNRKCGSDEMYARHHPGAKPGRYVMLAVTDSGLGMSAETLAHIFEPFFTTKEVGKGTGLGLATVYGVVKQSGGYVWVESEMGKGSSFQVFLPRVEESVVPTIARDLPPENLKGTETVLLVEDADALRKLARSFLADHGFHVLAAPNGEAAVEITKSHNGGIDLLLTDVVMPGMNGRCLADQLLAKWPALKVIFISGYTDSFISRARSS